MVVRAEAKRPAISRAGEAAAGDSHAVALRRATTGPFRLKLPSISTRLQTFNPTLELPPARHTRHGPTALMPSAPVARRCQQEAPRQRPAGPSSPFTPALHLALLSGPFAPSASPTQPLASTGARLWPG
jgi:hypothetical protein